MRRARLAAFGVLLAAATLALVACSGDDDDSDAPTPTFADATAAPADAAHAPGTSVPAAAPAAPTGDADNGKQLFTSSGCAGCHSTGDNALVGPGLGGVFERAAGRVSGVDAVSYIKQSLADPGAFVVDGFASGLMPTLSLSDGDIDDIVAYLATLK